METERLARMERAAQETSDPASIEANAQRPEPKLRALLAATEAVDPHAQLLGYLRAATLILTILASAKAIEVFLIGRVPNRVSRFNLKRIFRLLVGLATVFFTIPVLFANWYTAFVSLGLISLMPGFALQMPISRFIARIYILARAPYRVGDRIKIGEAHGDVIDVSYLVHPKEAGRVKTRLITRMLARMNAEPDWVGAHVDETASIFLRDTATHAPTIEARRSGRGAIPRITPDDYLGL